MRIFIAFVILLATSFSVSVMGHAQIFPDVSEDFWAKNEIYYLSGKGYVKGLEDGRYGVHDNMTRAQAAILLVRVLQLPTKPVSSPCFKDVPTSHYGSAEICTAAQYKLIQGADGKYAPERSLTRAELAAIIARAFSLNYHSQRTVEFTDLPESHWAFGNIQSLVYNNISNGYPDQTFKPEKAVNRAEFAVFLTRQIESTFKTKPIDILKYFPIDQPVEYMMTDNYNGVQAYLNLGKEEFNGQTLYRQHYARFVNGEDLGDNVDNLYKINPNHDIYFVDVIEHGSNDIDLYSRTSLMLPGNLQLNQVYKQRDGEFIHRLVAKGYEDLYAGGTLLKDCLVVEETFENDGYIAITSTTYYYPGIGIVKFKTDEGPDGYGEDVFMKQGIDDRYRF